MPSPIIKNAAQNAIVTSRNKKRRLPSPMQVSKTASQYLINFPFQHDSDHRYRIDINIDPTDKNIRGITATITVTPIFGYKEANVPNFKKYQFKAHYADDAIKILHRELCPAPGISQSLLTLSVRYAWDELISSIDQS